MNELKHTSKFLSLILRHSPQEIGLALDEQGWADVEELIEKSNRNGNKLDKALLMEVVRTSDKQRFAWNEDQTKIRANQGHSVNVDLQFEPKEPLEWLYHGTVNGFLDSIREEGLRKGNRLHVHLSKDRETAEVVGNRRGKATLLRIHAGQMHRDGHAFYLSANGVWLCDAVPANYIEFP